MYVKAMISKKICEEIPFSSFLTREVHAQHELS